MRLYGTKAFALSILLIACSNEPDQLIIKPGDGITDIESNFYPTVVIGKQEWFAKNLKTTKLNDGTAIPFVTDQTNWFNLSTPSYTWFNNDISFKETFGGLYNWYTVETGKCCPSGWHVPTDDEWTTLINTLGGASKAGGKLKEAGTDHWNSPNIGATNETGFTALPGGYMYQGAPFDNMGTNGFWWCSTEFGTDRAYSRIMFYNDENVVRHPEYYKVQGLSIRCIKD